MNISKVRKFDTLTINVEGKITAQTAVDFEKFINDNIDGVSSLILDFKDTDYVSSAGLRVILKAKKVMNTQGTMKIVNVQEDVMRTFVMVSFPDIITIEQLPI